MAKRSTKAQREQAEADKFRTTAKSLLHLRDTDWNDWEFDWLSDEVRRPAEYLYTEKERAVLDRLIEYSKSFTHSGGYSVPELIAIAYLFRFDLDEDGGDFLERLHRSHVTELRLRQIARLLRICRCFAGIDVQLDEAASRFLSGEIHAVIVAASPSCLSRPRARQRLPLPHKKRTTRIGQLWR